MVLLGSTGSIGKQTLKLAHRFGIEVEGLVAGNRWQLLAKQIEQFSPRLVAVQSELIADLLKRELKRRKVEIPEIFWGEEGILELLTRSHSQKVLNGLVGEVGVKPTLKGVKLGKTIGLANKESLVVAGKFIDTTNLFPIDSEHFGVWELVKGRASDEVTQIIITASGGAIRNIPVERLSRLSTKEVLNHPNWQMGAKITVDSSTMVNKLFEVLEAYWLFKIEEIDGIIEPSSRLHSLIRLANGGILAHLSTPDMGLPIANFLLKMPPIESVEEKEKKEGMEKNGIKRENNRKRELKGVKREKRFLKKTDRIISPLQLIGLELRLLPIDLGRYPLWQLRSIILKKPDLGVVINSLNDQLVKLFLEGKITFPTIGKTILKGIEKFEWVTLNKVEDIWEVRTLVVEWLKGELKHS